MLLKLTILNMIFMSQGILFKGVNAPSYDKKGNLESLLTSQTAVHQNSIFILDDVKLLNYGSDTQTITTPSCKYDPVKKSLNGNEKIEIKSRKMNVRGKGFDFDQNTKILKIHSDVVVNLTVIEEKKQ